MTRMMIGPALLLAAMVPTDARPVPAPPISSSTFRPTNGVTARSTATIRILSAARFGSDQRGKAPGAIRRSVRLVERDGSTRSAEILEFQ